MNCIKFAFVMLCLGMISCAQMNDDAGIGDLANTEMLASEETGFVHTVRKDDVRFKFCLLNELGEPANAFREGENFSFHFEMENLKENDKREYIVHHMGRLFSRGFCRVYTRSEDLAVAIFHNEAACAYVFQSIPFDGENRLNVNIPMYDDNGEWPYYSCTYRRNSPVALPKGTYSTGFTCTFEYRIPPVWDGKNINAIPPSTFVEVGPITMNIDFTIE
jgi:hypothetical protein